MSIWAYLQVELVPFLVLMLTMYLSKTGIQSYQNMRRFQNLVLFVMCILVVDCGTWYTFTHPFAYRADVIWLINITYFLLTELIAYYWFLYVYYQIHNNVLTSEQAHLVKLSVIPLLIVCGIIVCSPWNHMVFTVNPVTQDYARGTFHWIQVLCGFSYMFLASVCAYRESRKAQLLDQKKEYRFLCYIVLLPFIGGALQLLNFDFVFLWPFTAASLFLILIDLQKYQISVDALTSLNNRGTLERYLQQKLARRESGWYLLMIDVDHFKLINDKYGHMEGDQALQTVAKALQNVFGPTNAFISRYGGDEFMVISEFASDAETEVVVERFQKDLNGQVRERGFPYEIQTSAGYAQFTDEERTPLAKIIQLADRNMYMQKKAKA